MNSSGVADTVFFALAASTSTDRRRGRGATDAIDRRASHEDSGAEPLPTGSPLSVEVAAVRRKGFRLQVSVPGIAAWMGLMQIASTAILILGLTPVAGTFAYPIRVVANIIGVLFLSRLLVVERLDRDEWIGTPVAIVGVAFVASPV